MVFPTENTPHSSSKKDHLLLKPCLTSIDGSEAPQNRSAPSSPDLKTLSFTVSFNGWRYANSNFKSWARKMAALHEPIWRKVGIFEAVMASTYKIRKNTDVVLGIAEKWCPETKTFVFPWGETTITLEDVMVLLGFSVLGSPVFATLDSSGEKIKAKLEKEWREVRKDKYFVTQVAWMGRFMDSGDELEHVAFLVLWLSYFVFPSRFYHLYEAIFPIAVHLSIGTRIALAPAVLANLYAELSFLKNHIKDFSKSTITVKADLTALFKLVQVWTWERFREIQPKHNPLLKGEPRLALWHDLKQRTSDARQILNNSKFDSIEWRPYTKIVKFWEFPKFYPQKEMWVPVCPSLDDEFISFARCIKVSELVGIDNVEHYFPNRVASQFGMLQDVPSPVNQNNLSQEAAWNDYNKPIDDLTLYIPSRSAIPCVTPMFCEWWRKSFPRFKYSSEENLVVESAETFKETTIIDDDNSFVPTGSRMNRTSEDGMKKAENSMNKRRKYMKQARENGSKMERTSKNEMKVAEDLNKRRKYMKPAREKRLKYMMKQARENGSKINKTSKDRMKIAEVLNKRHKYMKRARENNESSMGRCQTQVPSDNDAVDYSLTIAQVVGLNKKNSGEASEPLGKKSRLEADSNDSGPCQKLASIRNDGHETVQPPEIEQRTEEPDEIGSKAGENAVSPPETRQTCDDEPDVHGSNAEKKTKTDDGNKEPDFLLHKDGVIAGEAEKEDDVVDDDSLIRKKLAIDELALKAYKSEPRPSQKLSSGGANGDETSKAYKNKALSLSDELNVPIAVGEGSQGQDCLLHDNGIASEETIKTKEQLEDLEKRNNDLGEGDVDNDSNEKRFQELKVLASSIEERFIKAEKKVAWLKERRAIKQRKLAAARLI